MTIMLTVNLPFRKTYFKFTNPQLIHLEECKEGAIAIVIAFFMKYITLCYRVLLHIYGGSSHRFLIRFVPFAHSCKTEDN